MSWCKNIWKEGTGGMITKGGRSPVETVICAANTIARESHDQPWETCKRQLESLREVAGHVDKAWLK